MKISGAWIDHPGPQALCVALEARGFKALFVGGCVRNAVLDAPISDIDLTTDATPEAVLALAHDHGFRAIPTGIEHGTITLIVHDMPIEVTTFRRDVETDGRRAVVAFSTDIREDAARRDFTMNALYADARGAVIDPLGTGLADALTRTLRFVGDPHQRIREDYLRILRFFRFYAHYGDPGQGIDADGLSACAELAEGVETLSRERIGAEMRKLLSAPDPAPAVAAMFACGVLGRVLPGADPRFLPIVVHLDQDQPRRWVRRLAMIGGQNVAKALRLSTREARDFDTLRETMGSAESPAVLGWKWGVDLAMDAVILRAAQFESPLEPHAMTEAQRGATAEFPVQAADLMPAFAGPELGRKLRDLQQRWLQSDLHLTRGELLG